MRFPLAAKTEDGRRVVVIDRIGGVQSDEVLWYAYDIEGEVERFHPTRLEVRGMLDIETLDFDSWRWLNAGGLEYGRPDRPVT